MESNPNPIFEFLDGLPWVTGAGVASRFRCDGNRLLLEPTAAGLASPAGRETSWMLQRVDWAEDVTHDAELWFAAAAAHGYEWTVYVNVGPAGGFIGSLGPPPVGLRV